MMPNLPELQYTMLAPSDVRLMLVTYGRAVAEACAVVAAKQGSAFAAYAIREAAKEIGK